jgi:hypothetical protein
MCIPKRERENLQPINPNCREILDVQSNQRSAQPISYIGHLFILQLILQFNCELVGLELESSTDGIHADAYDRFDGRQDHLEEEECNNSGRLGGNCFGEIKRAEQGGCVQEGGKEGEDGKDVELRYGHEFGRVVIIPVAKLMG